jgi:hypothetical protein
LIKKLATSIVLCLLGLAILSNRYLALRQFRLPLDQDVSFHLPVDTSRQSQPGRRTLLIATPNEGVSDPQLLSQDYLEIKKDAGGPLQDSPGLFRLQTHLASRPPTYILQSVLNL